MSDAVGAVRDSVRTILHDQHRRWRDIVTGLDAEALNWKPGDETNSLAVLVSHSLDAERFLLANSVDVELDRDREAKFRVEAASADELLALINSTEQVVDGYLNSMTADSLSADVARAGRTRTGSWWALHAVEHSCEHVGQAELTRQMWEQRS